MKHSRRVILTATMLALGCAAALVALPVSDSSYIQRWEPSPGISGENGGLLAPPHQGQSLGISRAESVAPTIPGPDLASTPVAGGSAEETPVAGPAESSDSGPDADSSEDDTSSDDPGSDADSAEDDPADDGPGSDTDSSEDDPSSDDPGSDAASAEDDPADDDPGSDTESAEDATSSNDPGSDADSAENDPAADGPGSDADSSEGETSSDDPGSDAASAEDDPAADSPDPGSSDGQVDSSPPEEPGPKKPVPGEVDCPMDSPAGSRCWEVRVSCPMMEDAIAQVRFTWPDLSTAGTKGTVILTTGGGGTTFYRGLSPQVASMVDSMVNEGLLAAEVAWNNPGIWRNGEEAGPRTLACRYNTLARWIYDKFHEGGDHTLFAALGSSSGSAQIAFALAHYSLNEVIDLAVFTGGPPANPPHGPRPGPESLLNGDPRLYYPTTITRFFLGANEPNAFVIDQATAYFDAIQSTKTLRFISNAEHMIELTQQGRTAVLSAVREVLQ